VYVLTVLDLTIAVYRRPSGQRHVHVQFDGENKPLLLEVNNAGADEYR
jgi:hypothetical protein